jgi:predicted nucleic acid-binding protein
MAILVVDASVACKAVVDEQHSDAAHALFAGTDHLLAPSYLLIECANALRKKVAAGQLEPAGALAAYDDLAGAPLELLAVTAMQTREALGLALAIAHPVQDCIYLALARERGARVVTADVAFVRAVRRHRGLASLIVPITEAAAPR